MFVDSGWARETATRKSTSGGAVQFGGHRLRSWPSAQSTTSLPSGEAEFYALAKGGPQALAMRSMFHDLSSDTRIRLRTDATAGKHLVSRRSLGRVRHIDVAGLWIQQPVREGDSGVLELKNNYNPSGVMTKHLGREDMDNCVQQLARKYLSGRSDLAPQLNALDESGIDIMLAAMHNNGCHL